MRPIGPGSRGWSQTLTMGHVGLVLGLEMSRLARAGQDWHQLIELRSLAGALLADADGVYDPNWCRRISLHCPLVGVPDVKQLADQRLDPVQG